MSETGDAPFSAGFSRVTVGDPDTGERITAGIWYPTQAREAAVSEQSRTFVVARDAMPAAGSYPLVLLSHGSGAWYGAHHDTAEYLARRGFVVASLTHPGDNFQDLGGYLGARQLLGRQLAFDREVEQLRVERAGAAARPDLGAEQHVVRRVAAVFSEHGPVAALPV